MLTEWWDPVTFWSAQQSAIKETVESSIKGYQIALLERQKRREKERANDLIEQRYREEERIILGIQSVPLSTKQEAELEQLLAEANQFLEETRLRLVASTISWGDKCRTVSQEKLEKAKR